ncbi:MAG: NAD(P)-dependent glycerol-1-phosphate dehydrogenase [Desulfurococcaceae archaeon TW002]
MKREPHVIDLPKKIIVGMNVLWQIPKVIQELRLGKKVFIITGPNVWGLVGSTVEEMMSSSNVTYEVSKVSRPTLSETEALHEVLNNFLPDLIIGLGGGKPIDIAKYLSASSGIPFMSVPTTSSHDGIASPFASLKGGGKITSVPAKPPVAIIADLNIIASAPHRVIKAGAGDLIAKFTAVLDWRLAHRLKGEYYGDYSAQLALLSAKHVVNSSDLISKLSVEGVRIIVEGLISSSVAMCIAGSSRPASGSEHLFSHALDFVANYPALHGEQVGVGTILMSYLHGLEWRKIKKVLRRIGLPTTAKELGVKDVDVINALTMAHKIRAERYTILGESGLTYEAAEKLAKETEVID